MKIIGTLILIMGLVACGGDEKETPKTDAKIDETNDASNQICGNNVDSKTFKDLCVGGDQTLEDKAQKLEWINDKDGCELRYDTQDHQAAAKFCKDLDFAKHMDWRLPTQDELSVMIIAANNDGVTLNYINNGCKAVIATEGFVKTEKTSEPGKKIDSFPHSGIRCVRNIK